MVTLLADFSGAGSGRTTNRVLAGLGVPPRLALDEMLLRSTNAAAVDFLLRLHYSFSARAALWALLRAAQSSPHVLRRAWTTVWEVLGRLRDVRCLPVSMVADGDAGKRHTQSC